MNLRRTMFCLGALGFAACSDDAPAEAIGCQSDAQCSVDGSQVCVLGTCQGATTSTSSASSETTQGTASGTTSDGFTTTGATGTTASADVTTSDDDDDDDSTSSPSDDSGTTSTTTVTSAGDETAGCDNPLTADGVVEMYVPLTAPNQGQRFNLLHQGTTANPGLPFDLDGAVLIVRAYAPSATNAQLRVFFRSTNAIESRAFLIPLEDISEGFVDVTVPVPAAAGGFDPTDIDVIRFEVEAVPGSAGPWRSPATIVYLDSLMSDGGEVNHPFHTNPFCQVFCDSGSRPVSGSQRLYHEVFVDESNCLPPAMDSSTGEFGDSTGDMGDSTGDSTGSVGGSTGDSSGSTGEGVASTGEGVASTGDLDASTGSVASGTGG